jgi:hypothetical protein
MHDLNISYITANKYWLQNEWLKFDSVQDEEFSLLHHNLRRKQGPYAGDTSKSLTKDKRTQPRRSN